MRSSIMSNVFCFKDLRALHLEDVRILHAYSETFQGRFMPSKLKGIH